MEVFTLAVAAVTGYLVGSLSFSRIIAGIVSPGTTMETMKIPVPGTDDVYEVTATGASAAGMSHGTRAGCIIGLLDIAKAFVPVLAARLLFPGEYLHLIVAVAVTIGHIWPVYYGFKGGRGISTIYGGLLAIDPIGVPIVAFTGLLIGLLVLHDFTIGYLLGVVIILPWVWLRTGDANFILYAVAINIVHAVGMIPDYRQFIKLKSEGTLPDMRVVMEYTPMGRGLLKIAKFLRIELRG